MSDPTDITTADIQAAIDSTTSASSASSPAAADSAPAAPASSDSASAGAAVQPDDVDLTAPEWGDIPTARRPTIAKNIRDKAVAAARKEWDEQTKWTQGIPREDFEAYRREQAIAGSMSPADYVLNLYQRVQADPQHGPQLRSMAAKILGQRQAPSQQPAVVDQEPEPDIPTDASQGVPVVYSAKQQRLHDAWLTRQILAQVGQQLAPLQETHQTLQQQREQAQAQSQANAYAARTFEVVSKWTGFKEHAASIMEKYAAISLTDPRTEGEKLRDVYSEVVLPTLTSAARQQAVTDITRKASASTINPNAATTNQPFDHTKASWKESIAYELARKGITV